MAIFVNDGSVRKIQLHTEHRVLASSHFLSKFDQRLQTKIFKTSQLVTTKRPRWSLLTSRPLKKVGREC